MTKKKKKVGIDNGKLTPCPKSPNCVSTQSPEADQDHYIKIIELDGSAEDAKNRLISIISSMKRSKITEQNGNYIRTEFKSALFKFVDDVEFYIDETGKEIHFRSASRVGYGDMGVNRKRMEKIRELYQK
jgi:uncharacterized protein (DUF1499 family)